MAQDTSVVLEDRLSDFIASQVKAGRYASPSDVVKAGLRLLEEEEAKREALRDAIREGEESGPATDFDFDRFLARMNAEHGV